MARSVHTNDGRFSLSVDGPGEWDVIIAAPGLARRVLVRRQIENGKVLDLGDVALSRGHVIQGVVRDEAGAPFAGARVDVSAITKDGRASLPADVPDADATIDLTASAAGGIEVTVHGAADSIVDARPVGNSGAVLHGQKSRDVVRFDCVPEGDYNLELLVPFPGAVVGPERVSVAAGQVTSTTLSAPVSAPVAITVHSADGPCRAIELLPPGQADPAHTSRCSGNEAAFPAVTPGRYWACTTAKGGVVDFCSPVAVQPAPALQTFEITR